jgi:predicted N-acetyltransferase YhbS
MTVEIRRARPDELAEVGRLTAEVYVGDGYLAEGDRYVAELVDTRRRAREAELLVAVEDGRVLGSVTFAPVGSAYREIGRDDEGEFRMLAVSPAARGRGIGRALVEHCVDRSRELGYAGVRMCSMDVMTGAHRVYERLGFTRAPEDDWRPEPDVLLLAYAARLG